MQITARNEVQYTPSPALTRGASCQQPQLDEVRHAHRERHRHEEQGEVDSRHVQRTLKHLVRDVRSDIKDELAELAAAGNLDPQYAEAVKSLVHDFRDDLQDVYQAAGRRRDLDPQALREGVGQAMATLTEGLAALREARDDVATVPVEPPAPQDPPAEVQPVEPQPVQALPVEPQPVQASPVQAQLAVTFTAQVSVSYGLIVDLQA